MGTSKRVKTSYVLSVHLLMLLLIVNCSNVNLQVKDDLKLRSLTPRKGNNTSNSNEQNGGAKHVSHTIKIPKRAVQIDIDKKHLDVLNDVGKSNEVVREDVDKRNVSEPLLQSKGSHNQDIGEGNSNGESKGKGDAKRVGSEGSETEEQSVKDANEESSTSLMGIEKGKSRDEDCDPSNMCIDEKKNLTACLRVPGNDSPDLSLLIRNKGSRPVTITIIAPKFVQLEETKVTLKQKEDKKVKVTLAYEGMDSLIFLTTEDSRCTLDFRDFIPVDPRLETRYGFKLGYLDKFSRMHWLMFLSISALLVFGSAWMILNLRKRLFSGNEYETVDMELPVSGVSKTGPESNDHWDSSWEDNWDDEEAPMTPTLPATPNLLSRGLASRRLSKESWKD